MGPEMVIPSKFLPSRTHILALVGDNICSLQKTRKPLKTYFSELKYKSCISIPGKSFNDLSIHT